jgi:hypothetical protein
MQPRWGAEVEGGGIMDVREKEVEPYCCAEPCCCLTKTVLLLLLLLLLLLHN